MKRIVVKYRFFIIMLCLLAGIFIFHRQGGVHTIRTLVFSLREVVMVLPPIFILIGLMDVWVPREKMVRFMGTRSGLKGSLLAIFIGSAAAGPLYAAFPVAAMFMRKGVSFFNLMLFIGAWSTTKVPMLLFETSALERRFTLTRLAVNMLVIATIAAVLYTVISRDQKEKMYRNAGYL